MRIPRTRGGVTGFVVMILGLWAAIIPFVGPYFNYSMHNDQTWFWMMDRLWLSILPGAVAFFGGLILMGAATRASARTGALMAAAAGIWLVIGPTLSMVWNSGSIDVGPPLFGNFRQWLEWFGMYYGTGAVITAMASYAYGTLTTRPVVDTTRGAAAGAAAGYGTGRFRRGRAAERERAREREAVGAGATMGGAAAAPRRSTTDGSSEARTVVADRPATSTTPGTTTPATSTRTRRGGLIGRFRRRD